MTPLVSCTFCGRDNDPMSRFCIDCGKPLSADKLIDVIANRLDLDPHTLSACRAKLASSTLEWIAAARHSGVTRSPALVIGGRIYEGLNDSMLIQQLVEAELAPGVLGSLPRWRK